MTFDMVRDRIADMLEARSWSVEAARYVARLAAQSEIEGVRIEGSA
jgi:peptidyl-prolyl cis-trans isomerase C